MPFSSARILCIEDNDEAAGLILEALEECGYETRRARSGEEGLTRIRECAPDLVLCDVGLPGMSGFEMLERLLEEMPQWRHLPFLFLTALGDRDHELKGRRLGADDYVTKPVDFEMLAAIVATRLAKAARAQGASAGTEPTAALSEREREILAWAARGKTSGEIACILSLSKRTVDFHSDKAREKLGVATRIQAVIKALAEGMIAP
jgi:DNA-binding NarL/FixJ family response regulator